MTRLLVAAALLGAALLAALLVLRGGYTIDVWPEA